jgi:DNA polymerase
MRDQGIIENKEVMLKGLHYFCMSCRLCSLGCEFFTDRGKELDPHVFSNMSHKANYIIIGQNPGTNECIRGVPFIGDAGKNFDEELKKNGLVRDNFYISNLVKCHSPNNDKPSHKCMEICSAILRLELQIIRPKLIITLGAFSFDYFCPHTKYSDGLGTITKSEHGNVFSIYHPSPLNLNNPERRKMFNDQMRLLSKLVKKLGV